MIAVVMRILLIILSVQGDVAERLIVVLGIRSQCLKRVVQFAGRPAVSLDMVSEDGSARLL